MDYVLLIYEAEDRRQKATSEEHTQMMAEYGQFTRDLAASGRLGDSAPLEPTRTATTVQVRNGKRVVTDGPFAETREQLGGYYVIKTETAEQALELAARVPSARLGSIEVRPVMSLGLPDIPAARASSDDQRKEYILLIYENESVWKDLDEATRKARNARYGEFTRTIVASNHFVDGAPLQSVKTAESVRVPSGKRLVTDGPFAETREQLGGYYRVRADHLDQALDMAARIPAAETGSIEVRPILDLGAHLGS